MRYSKTALDLLSTLCGNQYFVISNNSFTCETAESLNLEAVNTENKTSSEIMENIKNKLHQIELKKQYRDKKRNLLLRTVTYVIDIS